jgi:predicted esterase YcpF (UPF0227 family)
MESYTVIYIHGFGSSSLSKKAQTLKSRFGNRIVIPSLPNIPKLSIETLKEIIESSIRFGDVYLVGASLGGYYALYLQKLYNLRAVVINPAVKPYIRLSEALPSGINYYDGSRYDWREEYLRDLKEMSIGTDFSKTLLLLQSGDEVLDYREALQLLRGAELYLEEGGDHSFRGFEKHLDRVENFLFQK